MVSSSTQFPPRPTVVVLASSEVIHAVLRMTLDRVGLDVVCFTSPRKAIEYLYLREIWRLAEPAPVALILELDFAVSNPLQVVREVRWRSIFQALPIFALTDNATDLYREQAQQAGVTAVFAKPFRIQHIQHALSSHLLSPSVQR
jgi:CheY-like chemotaxis protein